MPLIAAPRFDTWPPFQVRLTPAVLNDDDITPVNMDADPMSYFLESVPPLDGPEDDLDGQDGIMMEFDAGIQDSGTSSFDMRPSSPDDDSVGTPDDDDDEDYIRFMPGSASLSADLDASLVPKHALRNRRMAESFPSPTQLKLDSLLSPMSYYVPPSSTKRPVLSHRRGRAYPQLQPFRRMPTQPRLWRMPSADVWSIEEEKEEDLDLDLDRESERPRSESGYEGDGESVGTLVGTDAGAGSGRKRCVHRAAKPKKQVRFVLPGEVIC